MATANDEVVSAVVAVGDITNAVADKLSSSVKEW